MPESRGRTAAEREAARRERANRRARREGRPEPYPDPAVEPEAPPVPFGSEAAAAHPPAAEPVPELPAAEPEPGPPAAEPEPEPEPEPPAAEPVPEPPAPTPEPPAADLAPEPPAADSVPEPPAVPEPEPPAAPEPERPATAEPAAASASDPLIGRRGASSQRPIKSFPSPPDPEFYVPDDQLEMPSGTRRVSRGSRVRAGGHRGRSKPPRRPRAHRPHGPGRRWLGRFVALIALVLAAAIAWFAIELFQPFGVSPHGHVTVRIPERTSSATVARMLAADGVISSRFFFEARATLDGDRSNIRAGTYHLQRGMSYEAVLAKLTAIPKKARTSNVTIAEGHTRQYVARLLHQQHISGNYLAATRHSKLLDPRHYGAPKSTRSLEGFLFPDTFQLRDPIKVQALVNDQLKDFKRRFAKINLAVAHRHHLSAYDVVTIASLIEGESASAHDDRLVSSVIYNRLRDHMMLQLDSTTRYATGNLTGPLTTRQLNSKSPYNTRNHYGLPPGPIDSPGLTALRAAADPAKSNDLYFFTKPCTQKAVFASSYAQFQLLLVRDRRLHCPKK